MIWFSRKRSLLKILRQARKVWNTPLVIAYHIKRNWLRRRFILFISISVCLNLKRNRWKMTHEFRLRKLFWTTNLIKCINLCIGMLFKFSVVILSIKNNLTLTANFSKNMNCSILYDKILFRNKNRVKFVKRISQNHLIFLLMFHLLSLSHIIVKIVMIWFSWERFFIIPDIYILKYPFDN